MTPTPFHRLTLDQVVEGYKRGLLSLYGALYYLVLTSAREGLPVKVDTAWLQDTLGTHRSSIWRALTKLEEMSLLEIDNFVVRVKMPKRNICLPNATFVSQTQHLSPKCNKRRLKQRPRLLFRNPPDLQIYRSKEREREPQKSAQEHKPVENLDKAYRDWLLRKARSLPTLPTLLESWIEHQAEKLSNQKQFEEEQALRDRTIVPPPIVENPKSLEDYQAELNRRMEARNDRGLE